MGILSALQEMLIAERPAVESITERCLRGRLNTCDCRLCLDVCPAGALSLIERRIHIDQEKCTACMCCCAVCPNDALDTDYDVAALLTEMSSRQQVVISCDRNRKNCHDEVAVPCLGIFSKESLLALGRSGCDRITFNMRECRSCINHQAAVRFRSSLEDLLCLGATELTTRLDLDEEQTRAGETESRRSYLSHFIDSVSLAARIGEGVRPQKPKERVSGRRIPAKVRILESVLNNAAPEERERLQLLCGHHLTVNSRCTLCPRCSAVCPTGALKVHRVKPKGELRFAAEHCSGCGLCVSFCKEKALVLRGSRMLVQPISITYKGSSAYVENPPR